MHFPLTRHKQAQKTANLVPEIGTAALLGLVYGNIARSIPILSAARVTNPGLYDAALGAAVVATVNGLSSEPENEPPEPSQAIPAPGWNLM